jgi:hypothetical protein
MSSVTKMLWFWIWFDSDRMSMPEIQGIGTIWQLVKQHLEEVALLLEHLLEILMRSM